PLQILDPATLAALWRGRVEAMMRLEVHRMHFDGAVPPGAQRDPHGAFDRHGEHETIIVVGMLADQVDPPRRSNEEFGGGTVAVLKCIQRAASGGVRACGHSVSPGGRTTGLRLSSPSWNSRS